MGHGRRPRDPGAAPDRGAGAGQPDADHGRRLARRAHADALRPPVRRPRPVCQRRQLHRVRGLRDDDQPAVRRRAGLGGRAHQRAMQGARLPHRDHLDGHALHPLCHRVAVPVRPRRAIQRPVSRRHRGQRHPVQRLLAVGHDPGRGLPVVAAGVPAAIGHLPRRKCRDGGGRADERGVHLRHRVAHLAAPGLAGDPGDGAVRVHPQPRELRRAGADRHAGPGEPADHRHLLQHQGSAAAARPCQRVLGGADRHRLGAAGALRPRLTPCRPLRERHRQGLPAAALRPRAVALGRGPC